MIVRHNDVDRCLSCGLVLNRGTPLFIHRAIRYIRTQVSPQWDQCALFVSNTFPSKVRVLLQRPSLGEVWGSNIHLSRKKAYLMMVGTC